MNTLEFGKVKELASAYMPDKFPLKHISLNGVMDIWHTYDGDSEYRRRAARLREEKINTAAPTNRPRPSQ